MDIEGKSDFKTLIIVVWFGEWPVYMNVFIHSIGLNSWLDLLVVSDQKTCPYNADNVTFNHIPIPQFNQLVSDRLGFELNINNARKLCDLKPLYGQIFDKFLDDCDYWAFADLDLVFGNLETRIFPMMEKKNDVISLYEDFLSGPLCFFKNSEQTRQLYKKINHHREILQDPTHYAMDENNKKETTYLESASFFSRMGYFIRNLFPVLLQKKKIADIKFSYQWYLKRKASARHSPNDMTEVVINEANAGNIKTSFQDILHSDRDYKRSGRKDWILHWQDGVLRDTVNKREIPVFHFIDMKQNMKYTLQAFEKKSMAGFADYPESFTIDQYGFHK